MRYAKWLGLVTLALFALPTFILTCFMVCEFGLWMAMAMWARVGYQFLFGEAR